MEQLTELVEKMSAKIVLLETRLQLMEGGTKDNPHIADIEPLSLETSLSANTSTFTKSELTPVTQHTAQPHSKFLYRADSVSNIQSQT